MRKDEQNQVVKLRRFGRNAHLFSDKSYIKAPALSMLEYAMLVFSFLLIHIAIFVAFTLLAAHGF